jgi:type IV pilus assembly protein PilO
MNIRDPRTQKIILASCLSLVVLYFFFFTEVVPFTYKARQAKTKKLEVHLSKLSADLTKARAAVANLPALEAEYAEVERRWESMAELLPNSKEIASLLTKVTVAGQESGVDFALFQPGAQKVEEFFVTYPAQYRIEGGYHEVGRFMAEVANLDRIVNIADLNLTAVKPDDDHPRRTVIASFIAEAYAFQDSTSSPAASGTRGNGAPAKAPAAGSGGKQEQAKGKAQAKGKK